MYNRVCFYECYVRKGKILFPWFPKCEKKVELSGHEAKTLIVIYNLSADGPPSTDVYLAPARKELEYDMLRGTQQAGRIKRGRGHTRKTKDVEEVENKELLHCDMYKS